MEYNGHPNYKWTTWILLMTWGSPVPHPTADARKDQCWGGTFSTPRAEHPWMKEQYPQSELI